ncbi:MAG: hypothetical protein DI527_00965 [Chelatococcus sp.]|nr:MAG: hypothetical protein DI527_00965 [Chelatococcus sp.]
MSRSEAERIRSRQDKAARAAARKAKQERAEAREAEARAALEAEQARLVAEARAARAAGTMPALPRPGRKREALKPGRAPILGERTVDDPLQAGAKMRAVVNLAEHPLEMMLARQRLTRAQYEAGVRFRAIYERAMIGPGRGIDPAHIKVDGGGAGDPLSDAVVHAHWELKRLASGAGLISMTMLTAICGRGETVSDLARRWPAQAAGRARQDYVALRFLEALDHLAEEVWGAKGPERGRIVGERGLGSGEIDMQAVDTANQSYLRRRGIAL